MVFQFSFDQLFFSGRDKINDLGYKVSHINLSKNVLMLLWATKDQVYLQEQEFHCLLTELLDTVENEQERRRP